MKKTKVPDTIGQNGEVLRWKMVSEHKEFWKDDIEYENDPAVKDYDPQDTLDDMTKDEVIPKGRSNHSKSTKSMHLPKSEGPSNGQS